MATYYCSPTGNDTTGDGSMGNPYKTMNKAKTVATAGDTVRLEKTTKTNVTGANCTWTRNSAVINTSASLIGSIVVGDYVGRPIAAGNGSLETFYRVTAVTASAIGLESRYAGTTGTDTNSIYKTNATDGMSTATGNAMLLLDKSLTVEGGFDFSTGLQDGETWVKHAGLRTGSSNMGFQIRTPSTIDKVNVVECYRAFFPDTTGASGTTISNCTGVGSYLTVLDLTGAGNLYTLTNLTMNGPSFSAYPAVQISSATVCDLTTVNAIGNQASSSSAAIGIPAANSVVYGGNAYCTAYAFSAGGTSVKLINPKNYDCPVGVIAYQNFYIENYQAYPTINNFFCHIQTTNLVTSGNVVGGNFAGASQYSIWHAQSKGIVIDGATFQNNGIDCYYDGYCGDNYLINTTHTTPTSWAISKSSTAGTVNCRGCSIDAPSIAKAYQIPTIAGYNSPLYTLQDSFGLTGNIYSTGNIVRDTSILSPGGYYTVQIAYPSTVNTNYSDIPVGVKYAKGGVAQNVTYEVRANGVWTGTIIPKLKLNGVTIKTGTSITTVSNGSFDSKSISATAGEVTGDGELTLEFNINGNGVAINIGDINVT